VLGAWCLVLGARCCPCALLFLGGPPKRGVYCEESRKDIAERLHRLAGGCERQELHHGYPRTDKGAS
jgi:hypothetical protein